MKFFTAPLAARQLAFRWVADEGGESVIAGTDRYPRPNWEEVAARIADASPNHEDAAWRDIAKRWTEEVCAAAGKRYRLTVRTSFPS